MSICYYQFVNVNKSRLKNAVINIIIIIYVFGGAYLAKKRIFKRKKKKVNVRNILIYTVSLAIAIVSLFLIIEAKSGELKFTDSKYTVKDKTNNKGNSNQQESKEPAEKYNFSPKKTDNTVTYTSEIKCEYGVLIDAQTGEILVDKGSADKIYPASMTKLMTLLVADEHCKNLTDKFTMTFDIIHPLVMANASRAGFSENEQVTVKDLMYGAILPSGADGTVGLAMYVAGSEEKFVDLMNKKAQELGMTNTHFMNSSGLHNDNHYSTLQDISKLMKAVMDKPNCKEIISTFKYTTEKTEQHPDGIELSSDMFSKMYGNEAAPVSIEGGKTGYTTEAGLCLASYAKLNDKQYIAVTAKGKGKNIMVLDTIELYKYLNK